MPAPEATRIWYVESPSPELGELVASPGSGIRSMDVLPLVVVPAGHPRAEEPPPGTVVTPPHRDDDLTIARAIDVFVSEMKTFFATEAPGGCTWLHDPGYPFLDRETMQLTMGIGDVPSVQMGFPATLSLSLQIRGPDLDPLSPLAVATRIASRLVPVFVAAGNCRGWPDGDSRSALARLPWVISVGATADEDGTAMTPTSSIGADGGPGPTIVAYGENQFVAGVNETSFAAPYAASLATWITAFLLQIRAAMTRLRIGELVGVPLLVQGFVDVGFDGFDPAQARPLPMIPFGYGIDLDSCRAAYEAMHARGILLTFGSNPGLVTSLLLRSVRPGPGAPHESGAGTVTGAGVQAMLASLTWRDLLEISGYPAPDDPVLDRRIADAETLALLCTYTTETRLLYGFDFRNPGLFATVRPPRPR